MGITWSPTPAPTPTPGPTVMVRHLCRMNGIPHDMWGLWADTFCAYGFGVSYWSNNGYGDWIFGVEGCYLSQVDESQQNAGLWIGGTYVESLAWRNYMTEFTLSATARYDFNWNGEDDYIVTHLDNHASVYVRAYQRPRRRSRRSRAATR